MHAVLPGGRLFQTLSLSARAFRLFAVFLAVFLVALSTLAQAQIPTPSIVYSFQGSPNDIEIPSGVLAQGRDGNLYGTAPAAGANSRGGIYKLTPAGTETVLASFPSTWAGCKGVVLGLDGNFYGVCELGGAHNGGLVFQATPAGVLKDIFDFTGANGDETPTSVPVMGANGKLYGSSGNSAFACGNIYMLTTAGVYKNVKSGAGFCNPWAVSAGSDGNFYGTWGNTPTAGNRGAIFRVGAAGTYTEILDFVGTGSSFGVINGVILASNGKLYGNDNTGGAHTNGAIYTVKGATLTDLHDTNALTDGNLDFNNLLQASNGNFYGASFGGEPGNGGSFYELTSANAFSAINLSSNPATFGQAPATPLMQHTNGLIYGTTSSNGPIGLGAVLSFNIGAAPFLTQVSPVWAGTEGSQVQILGQGFDPTSVVRFGGVAATTPQITGSTFILANVPAGALTGKITVTTGALTLSSNATFKVKPTIASISPLSGPVTTLVTINGTGLKQTTAVKFHGTAATFTVVSDAKVTATVPAGATTGSIAVTTKGGSASSKPFTVN